jgi:hypothetical protein
MVRLLSEFKGLGELTCCVVSFGGIRPEKRSEAASVALWQAFLKQYRQPCD